jgi:hypothetical protein
MGGTNVTIFNLCVQRLSDWCLPTYSENTTGLCAQREKVFFSLCAAVVRTHPGADLLRLFDELFPLSVGPWLHQNVLHTLRHKTQFSRLIHLPPNQTEMRLETCWIKTQTRHPVKVQFKFELHRGTKLLISPQAKGHQHKSYSGYHGGL